MKKFSSVLAKGFAILFSIAFVLSAVMSLLLTSIDRRLFNASLYKNALVQQQVYDRLPGVLAEQLVMTMKSNNTGNNVNPPGGGTPAFLQNLTVDNWKSILANLAPPDLLRSEAEGAIDQVFAYLNGQQETVKLDLTPLKSRLVGSAGQDAIFSLIRAQPACTLQQIAQFMASALGGQGFGICRPPDSMLKEAAPLIQAALQQLVSQIPNEVVLLSSNSTQGSTGGSSSTNSLVTSVRNARLLMRLSPDLPLGFLLLISLLAVRTPKNWLRWWGIPLCVAGLVASMGVLALSTSFERIWSIQLASQFPSGVSLGLIALGHDLLRAVFQTWLDGLLLSCIFYCLLGLGMSIGSIFIRDGVLADHSPSSPKASV